ncbi:MAG: alkyl sulfatase dimerization domain-containing protein [Pseudomonadales bacterium]
MTTQDPLPDSISAREPIAGPAGQLAHPDAVAHLERLQPRLYRVGDHAWCLVGNGLSNQTFIDAPEGLIAIDTGDCVEEMRAALAAVRTETDKPVIACIYSHFHYVNGTRALLEESATRNLQIYGHAGIPANLSRFGGEIAPRSSRGLVHQFGLMLPEEGPDALLHCGLGLHLRNPAHAPFTPGYVPARHTFDDRLETRIGGLDVVMTHAPSDATDSITLWFPSLRLCVNNLIWPSLFNVFAIRGEEYRDPRIVIEGIDAIHELDPEHLIGTHGPPLSGPEVADAVVDSRDAIQFIWDQTVRGINRGLRLSELTRTVQLPSRFQRSYFTRQLYGLVEHHVRQIHAGLFGWLDEDESRLFPVPEVERAEKLIAGFGGRDRVAQHAENAIADGDWRWAAELATWLVRTPACDASDRERLAAILRHFATHTTSANVRNWCLTRALTLEGGIDLSRFLVHRFRRDDVLAAPPEHYVPVLRVLLEPSRAEGIDDELAWHFAGGRRVGLKLRGQVAIPTDGRQATLSLGLSHETWAKILSGRLTVEDAESRNLLSCEGDRARIARFLDAFDHPALSPSSRNAPSGARSA